MSGQSLLDQSDGHNYNDNAISGYANVHFGNVFHTCNHDLLDNQSPQNTTRRMYSKLSCSRITQYDVMSAKNNNPESIVFGSSFSQLVTAASYGLTNCFSRVHVNEAPSPLPGPMYNLVKFAEQSINQTGRDEKIRQLLC